MTTPADFYDELNPFYHLIYPDWEKSVVRQAADLDGIIKEYFGENAKEILDVSCGIGTQALGLAELGYALTCSDVSGEAVKRAETEADKRGLKMAFSVADMREAFTHHNRRFDAVVSCDNSVPHLLTDEDTLSAFRQFYECARPGGGCVITVRDYDKEERGGTRVKPYGTRVENGIRFFVFQVWEFNGDIYDLSMYFVEDRGDSACETRVMRTKYRAVGAGKLMSLLRAAGFADVKRLDDRFFQPVIVGKKE